MSVQVQELIDKIKNEGVQAANEEAARIVADARAKAAALVAEAEAEAKAASLKATAAIAKEAEAGKQALAQASRDLLLLLGGEIQKLLDRVVLRETKTAYSAETLRDVVPAIVSSWKGADDLSLLLPPADLAKLESFFAAKLKSELTSGLEIKPSAGLKAGFKIVERSGLACYDFSAEALSELISRHLNPSLAETMKTAAREL